MLLYYMRIENALLLDCLPLTKELCASKQSVINMFIQDQTLSIYSVDTDRSLTLQVALESGNVESFGIDALVFTDIIRKTDRSELWDVALDKDMSQWSNNSAKLKLMHAPADQKHAAITEEGEQYELNVSELKIGIKRVNFAIGKNDNNHILNGILFKFFDDRLELVTCDNFCLAVYKIYGEYSKVSEFVLPVKTISTLNAILQQDQVCVSVISYEDKVMFHGTFKSGEKIVSFQFVSSILMGAFPRYETVMRTADESYVLCDSYDLYKTIDQVSILAQGTSIVNLLFEDTKVQIKSQNVMLGEYVKTLDVQSQLDKQYSVDLRVHLVIGLLKSFDKGVIKIHLSASSKLMICTMSESDVFYAGVILLYKH